MSHPKPKKRVTVKEEGVRGEQQNTDDEEKINEEIESEESEEVRISQTFVSQLEKVEEEVKENIPSSDELISTLTAIDQAMKAFNVAQAEYDKKLDFLLVSNKAAGVVADELKLTSHNLLKAHLESKDAIETFEERGAQIRKLVFAAVAQLQEKISIVATSKRVRVEEKLHFQSSVDSSANIVSSCGSSKAELESPSPIVKEKRKCDFCDCILDETELIIECFHRFHNVCVENIVQASVDGVFHCPICIKSDDL